MADFPNDEQLGECKDCIHYQAYSGGDIGYCERIHGMIAIHNYPPVHETCWCSFFEEDS